MICTKLLAHCPGKVHACTMSGYCLSPSGVRIADDFRDNLIVDRYADELRAVSSKKMAQLKSENSEDVISWNVFRSLRQVNPRVWVPALFVKSFPLQDVPSELDVTVRLWPSIAPHEGIHAMGAEGNTEVDVLIECSGWVWFIEAKFRSDISLKTTARANRDQILRNIDVGSHYAGTRPFYFSLMCTSEKWSPIGVQKVKEYQELELVRTLLSEHRQDGLKNLCSLGVVYWSQVYDLLISLPERGVPDEEMQFACRAAQWLSRKLEGVKSSPPTN
jgi:hypothetical protein